MIPNLSCLDPAKNIWRGAQPITFEDWTALWDRGIRHVIKLNTASEGSDLTATELGMDVMECPITLAQQLLTEPDLQSLQSAVAFIGENTFIHCGSTERTKHAMLVNDEHNAGGNDRTGVCVGYYRVLRQGWTKADAYAEMLKHGYHPILLGLDKCFADLKEPTKDVQP